MPYWVWGSDSGKNSPSLSAVRAAWRHSAIWVRVMALDAVASPDQRHDDPGDQEAEDRRVDVRRQEDPAALRPEMGQRRHLDVPIAVRKPARQAKDPYLLAGSRRMAMAR